MNRNYIEVTKEQFEEFARNRKDLIQDVTAICDPPMLTLNDLSDNKKWPCSIVAKAFLSHYDNSPATYFILESEIEEVK